MDSLMDPVAGFITFLILILIFAVPAIILTAILEYFDNDDRP